jgi:hypothetical protein
MKNASYFFSSSFRFSILLVFPSLLALLTLPGCQKYLDAKPDQSLSTPGSARDFQEILDNQLMTNFYPYSADMASDDYFLRPATWSALALNGRNAYVWNPETQSDLDWQYGYQVIEAANVVADGVRALPAGSAGGSDLNGLLGSAAFFRGYALFQLAGVYTLPYRPGAGGQVPGLPIRLSPDITAKTERASLERTFDQIIADLTAAARLLPATQQVKTRPTKAAAFGALARTFLVMQDYAQAGLYADSCLKQYSQLIDYSTISQTATNAFAVFNSEVIFHAVTNGSGGALSSSRALVDTVLYQSYSNNDLRKRVFFRAATGGYYSYKGDYSGRNTGQLFNGIATDEVLLIRAECAIRQGKVQAGMADLNTLLAKRFTQAAFVPYATGLDAETALRTVLQERRKELVFRSGIRWNDLRRLNQDGRFSLTLQRNLNGTRYTLPPGDTRFAFLIPASVIQLTGIPQNVR